MHTPARTANWAAIATPPRTDSPMAASHTVRKPPAKCLHPRDALEGKGPQRRPQQRLGRRLEEVAKAVGGGYCRLQMPLKPPLGVRGTVAGHRLGALERGGGGVPPPLPMHPCSTPSYHIVKQRSCSSVQTRLSPSCCSNSDPRVDNTQYSQRFATRSRTWNRKTCHGNVEQTQCVC